MAFRPIKLAELLFGTAPAAPSADAPATERAVPVASNSVLHTINDLNRRLEHALLGLRDHANADTELRAIAAELVAAVRRAPEIALGTVLLNQIAGTYGVRHCTESAIVATLLGMAMAKSDDELQLVAAAALTMNVGMVRQAEMFHGRDGALTGEERAIVRRHPHESVDLLRWAGIKDEEWLNYVLLHHENPDGSGYPEGRMGDEIAANARLIALADRYCALVSARNYRRSLLPPVALERLAGEADPMLMQHFTDCIGAYPAGTLVRMQDGCAGVVVGGAKICLLRDGAGAMLVPPLHCLSTDQGYALAEALHEDQARLRFTMQQVWGELAGL